MDIRRILLNLVRVLQTREINKPIVCCSLTKDTEDAERRCSSDSSNTRQEQ